ncbi:MAG TPA: aminotransferase class V-fold PLP-dependent enzyme [Gemmatimonadales bacterium]|nr:aminotransferase class V-fold PLP-dependent enzyme [Gemmatimonadales bacterium]
MLAPVADDEPRLATWRADTPGAVSRVHLNNAGAALAPRAVEDAIVAHLAREAALGGYEAAEAVAPALEATYQSIARLIGAARRNVAVVQSATIGFSQALAAFDFAPGDRILTTRADYASNQLMLLSLARRRGAEVVRAADLPEGGFDPDSLRELVRERRPALVAISWVPTNSGLVQDVETAGAICAEAEVPFLVDACQAVGQLPVDVARVRCDYLAATARKFLRGPRGIGFLYVSDRALAAGAYPLLVDLRGATWCAPDDFRLAPDARRFETWELPAALVLGMGEAVRYALDVGVERARDRAWMLAARARERLAALAGVRPTDRGRVLSAIATAHLAGRDAQAIKLELRARGINTHVSARDDAVLDLDGKGAAEVLRVSPHYYNTAAEIDAAADALDEVLRGPARRRE